jgi:hypothetical protein
MAMIGIDRIDIGHPTKDGNRIIRRPPFVAFVLRRSPRLLRGRLCGCGAARRATAIRFALQPHQM